MATTLDRVASSLQRSQEASAKEIKDQTTLQEQMVKQLEGVYENIKAVKDYFIKDAEQQRKWREQELARQAERDRENKAKSDTAPPSKPTGEAKAVSSSDLMQALLMGAVLSKLGLDEAILAFKHGVTIIKNVLLEGGKILSKIVAPFRAALDFIRISFDDLTKYLKTETSIGKILLNMQKFFSTLAGIGKIFIDNPIVKFIFNTFKSFGDDVLKIVNSVLAPFKSAFTTAFKFIGSKLLFWVFGLIDFFTGFFEEYKKGGGFWKSLGAGINEFFRGFFTRPLDLLKDGLSWLMKKMGAESAAMWLKSFSFTEMYDKYLAPIVKNMFAAIPTAMKTIQDWILLLFADPVKAVKSLMRATGNILMDFGAWVFNKIISPVSNYLWGLLPANIRETISSLVGTTIETITNFGKYVYNNIIKPTIDWLNGLFTDPVKVIKELATDTLTAITDFGKFTYEKLLSPAAKWISNLFPEDITGKIKEIAGDSLDVITNFGKWVYDKTIKVFVDWVKSFFPTKESIEQTFKTLSENFNILKMLEDLGKTIKEAIKGLIRSALPDPNTFVGSIISKTGIYDAVKETPSTTAAQPQAQGVMDPGIIARSRMLDQKAIQQTNQPPVVPVINNVTNNNVRDSSSSGGVNGNINVNTSPGKNGYEDVMNYNLF